MRKNYLFLLMLVFPLATMFKSSSVFAADPPEEEYQAAMAAITDGVYYLVTEVGETKWYVTKSGYVTDDKENAFLFTLQKVSGGALYDVGILLETNAAHFSNTTTTNSKANLHPYSQEEAHYRQDGGNNRNDWERQVFYLKDGKFAIRSCNTAFGESSWADAGRAFWTYDIAETEDGLTYPVPCYSYEPAYVWFLEAPEGKEQLSMVLNNLYNTYEQQVWDDANEPIYVNMGTDFGQLADWETWRKFKAELDKLGVLVEKFLDEEYIPQLDPDCPNLDGANQWKAELDSMWQKIVDSEVPYKIEKDGYYRIMTRLRYYKEIKDEETGEVIDKEYMNKSILAPKTYKNAMFGTLRKDMANYVWKLTQHGDSIEIQNAGMESYVSLNASSRLILTNDESLKSHVMFDYAGTEVVTLDDGDEDFRNLFNIRLAKNPRHSGYYVHQNGHNMGKDSGNNLELSFWYSTYGKDLYEDDGGTSEYYLEPVSDEEVAELINAFEPYKNQGILVAQNNELRAKVAEAIEAAKDPIKTEQITSVDQLYSPYSDYAEGKNIGALIDGDASSFWHTDWHGQTEPITYGDKSCHYLLISGMENLVGNCNLYLLQRNTSNDHPSEITLLGANDPEAADEEWAEMAVIKIPHTDSGKANNVLFNVATPYQYIRFIATDCIGLSYTFRTYWHAAEIQLTTIKDSPNSQFNALGDIATNLEKVYKENCAVADEDVTTQLYEELEAAFKLYLNIIEEMMSISFVDANVKALCISNWDINEDGKLSYEEAATVKTIGDVFKGNTTINSFNELQYFTNLTNIDESAFNNCRGLTSISIPENVTEIGKDAFSFCYSLTDVYCLAEDPPCTNGNVFLNSPITHATLYVPEESLESYKNTMPWSNFGSIVKINKKGVKINENNFPDDDFRNYLLNKEYIKDEVLSDVEIAMITSVDVNNKGIKSLKGIEYLTALTSLFCKNNQLFTLDLSMNTALIKLECDNNKLTELDLSKNVSLTELSCSNNHLTELDVSKNKNLKIINLSNNDLTGDIAEFYSQLIIEGQTSPLSTLNISDNKLTGNIGYNVNCFTNLKLLNVSGNCLEDVSPMIPATVTSLDISRQTISRVVPLHLGIFSISDVGTKVPAILLYDHLNRVFSPNISLHCTTPDEQWAISMIYQDGQWAAPYLSKKNTYYGNSGDTINVVVLKNDGTREGSTFRISLSFDEGDSNFDGQVNVLDLQTSILYIMEKYLTRPYNFTAANLWNDDLINVQDVIRLVDLLIKMEPIESVSSVRKKAQGSKRETVASVSIQNGQIRLNSSEPVAAMDLYVSNASCINVSDNLERMGISVITKKTPEGLHIIAYSMRGTCIPSGITTIGTIDTDGSYIRDVMLSDCEANAVSVSVEDTTTGIEITHTAKSDNQEAIYDLQGRKISVPRKGLYIQNGHKVVK